MFHRMHRKIECGLVKRNSNVAALIISYSLTTKPNSKQNSFDLTCVSVFIGYTCVVYASASI